ncbi:MAG: DUF2460 domain-containing protein [Proteobacteria bacterium]|nr:DUF2460 domain-containing protein [Pseudomonadota bacterium]
MGFDNARFPTGIARGSSGGPERRTEVVTTASGREERNSRWAHSRRSYNVGLGVKTLDDLHAVIAFFEERRGRLHAFRFKDHADFKSCPPQGEITPFDQVIGEGDGITAGFQLSKLYGEGLRSYRRDISAPVAGTVRVAVDAVESSDFIVDETTGIVSFAEGHVPAAGAVVQAGFAFDVPVRFDTDRIAINLAHFEAGEIPDIPLLEVRP